MKKPNWIYYPKPAKCLFWQGNLKLPGTVHATTKKKDLYLIYRGNLEIHVLDQDLIKIENTQLSIFDTLFET